MGASVILMPVCHDSDVVSSYDNSTSICPFPCESVWLIVGLKYISLILVQYKNFILIVYKN